VEHRVAESLLVGSASCTGEFRALIEPGGVGREVAFGGAHLLDSLGHELHQQNVKTSPGPPRGVMVPLVLLVHPDPPLSRFSVKF